MPGQDRPVAHANLLVDDCEDYDQVVACGGTKENPHMMQMEFVDGDAARYARCPKCGSRTFLLSQLSDGSGGDDA